MPKTSWHLPSSQIAHYCVKHIYDGHDDEPIGRMSWRARVAANENTENEQSIHANGK